MKDTAFYVNRKERVVWVGPPPVLLPYHEHKAHCNSFAFTEESTTEWRIFRRISPLLPHL